MKPFVFALFVGFGALAVGGCSPSGNSNIASSKNALSENVPQGNEAVSNAAIVPSTDSTPTVTERASLVSNVWVPGKDDKLHLQPVSKSALDAQKKYGNPTAALDDIVRMAPKWFPPKTRVMQWSDNGKTISVNLNRNFASPGFWSKSGEKTTELAVYALVNSASVGGKPVVLQVEKRPVSSEELNGFDTSDPIEPDAQFQAQAGARLPKSGGATPQATATRTVAPEQVVSPRGTMSPAIRALPDADFSSPKTGSTLPGKTGAR